MAGRLVLPAGALEVAQQGMALRAAGYEALGDDRQLHELISGGVEFQLEQVRALRERLGSLEVEVSSQRAFGKLSPLHPEYPTPELVSWLSLGGDRTLAWAEAVSDYAGHLPEAFATEDEPEYRNHPAAGSSAMVAFVPARPEEWALPIDGALPPEELHVTCSYLGRADLVEIEPVHEIAERAAGAIGAPPVATVSGVGTLGQEGAVVLFLESEMLTAAHGMIDEEISRHPADIEDPEVEHYPNWVCHMTLGYSDDPGPMFEAARQFQGKDVTLDRLRVAVGEETTDYPLGVPMDEPEEEEMAMPPPAPPVEIAEGALVRWAGPDGMEMMGRVVSVNGDGTVTVQAEGGEPVVLRLEEVEIMPMEEEDMSWDPAKRRRKSGMAVDEDVQRFKTSEDGAWEGVLVVEGVPSGDGRVIQPEALTWRELPLPLMMMRRNPEGGMGHDGAELAGRIEWIDRRENGEVWAGGHLDLGSPIGQEALRLMGEGMLRGISADLDQVEVAMDPGADPMDMLLGGENMAIGAGRVMGGTLTPFPAFQEASVYLVNGGVRLEEIPEDAELDAATALAAVAASSGAAAFVWTPWDGALVASAPPPVKPPAEWFQLPSEDEVRELRNNGRQTHVGKDGRLYGIAARFGDAHIGILDRKVTAPRSASQYAYFMTGEVECADGSVVATGPLVTDTVHPSLQLKASDAQAFYAHTGAAAADVAMYEMRVDGKDYLVYAGAQRPHISDVQRRVLRASDGVSPDWRRIGGRLEMVGLLSVNSSGLKVPAVPDALAASAGPPPGQVQARFVGGEAVALIGADPVVSTVSELAAQVQHLTQELAAMQEELRAQKAQRMLEQLSHSSTVVAHRQAKRERADLAIARLARVATRR